MPRFEAELRSAHAELQRLKRCIHSPNFMKQSLEDLVRAPSTLNGREKIEYAFLAELFLLTWCRWTGLLDRYCRYFGRSIQDFPKSWTRFRAELDGEVLALLARKALDETISLAWEAGDASSMKAPRTRRFDLEAVYTQIARNHERATFVEQASSLRPKAARRERSIESEAPRSGSLPLPLTRDAVTQHTRILLDVWDRLPRRSKESLGHHLRHYMHSTLCLSWLMVQRPRSSALMILLWGDDEVHPTPSSPPASPFTPIPKALLEGHGTRQWPEVSKVVERISRVIAEVGYDALLEDALSPDLIGGDESLVGSNEVTVVPGNQADDARPILLALTRGWSGDTPLSFSKVLQQVKTRLIEAQGTINAVVICCDSWDSTSFRESFAEELAAHQRRGVFFLLLLVGVPDHALVPIPVSFNFATA